MEADVLEGSLKFRSGLSVTLNEESNPAGAEESAVITCCGLMLLYTVEICHSY